MDPWHGLPNSLVYTDPGTVSLTVFDVFNLIEALTPWMNCVNYMGHQYIVATHHRGGSRKFGQGEEGPNRLGALLCIAPASQCAILARLGALHLCPHTTVTWSPWIGGTQQYTSILQGYPWIKSSKTENFAFPWGMSQHDRTDEQTYICTAWSDLGFGFWKLRAQLKTLTFWMQVFSWALDAPIISLNNTLF